MRAGEVAATQRFNDNTTVQRQHNVTFHFLPAPSPNRLGTATARRKAACSPPSLPLGSWLAGACPTVPAVGTPAEKKKRRRWMWKRKKGRWRKERETQIKGNGICKEQGDGSVAVSARIVCVARAPLPILLKCCDMCMFEGRCRSLPRGERLCRRLV